MNRSTSTRLLRAASLLTSVALLSCGADLPPDEGAPSTAAALATSFNGTRTAFALYQAFHFETGTPADFDTWLAGVQAEYYTHVAMYIEPYAGAPFGKIEDLKNGIRNAALAVNNRGLKLLPIITVGSGGSGWWRRLTDPAVEMNRIDLLEPHSDGGAACGSDADCVGRNNGSTTCNGGTCWIPWIVESPTYAPNSNMDGQFLRLVQTIKDATTLPGGKQVTDSVLLSYDEFGVPYSSNLARHVLLPGGGPPGGATRTLSYSSSDRNYMSTHGADDSRRVATLVNTSIHRRMKTVQSVFGSTTKVLVYGDEWDPQATGGYRYHNYKSATTWLAIAPYLRNLTGLDATQQGEVKNGVIFMPWNYAWGNWPKYGGGADLDPESRYDAFDALSAFNGAGLKFIYISAFGAGLECEAKAAMQNYVRASRWFPNTSVGYQAAFYTWGPATCGDPTIPAVPEIHHDLYVANANMPATLKECPQHFEDHWYYPLTNTSVPWRQTWGDPSINTSTDRLILSYDDVVRRSPMELGYTLSFTVTFNGDMAVYPDVGISNLTTNYPALRRVGSQIQVGGLHYGGSNVWGSAGGFTGQAVTANTAKVTLYVKSISKQIAMRVEAGGSVFKSGFIPYPNFDPKVVQLVGGNNSGVGTSTSTITPIVGCGGIEDTWVTAIYNQ